MTEEACSDGQTHMAQGVQAPGTFSVRVVMNKCLPQIWPGRLPDCFIAFVIILQCFHLYFFNLGEIKIQKPQLLSHTGAEMAVSYRFINYRWPILASTIDQAKFIHPSVEQVTGFVQWYRS